MSLVLSSDGNPVSARMRVTEADSGGRGADAIIGRIRRVLVGRIGSGW